MAQWPDHRGHASGTDRGVGMIDESYKSTATLWEPTRRQFGVLAAAGLGSFCAGCAVNPATGDQQAMLMSADEERRIGAAEHPKILQEFGGAYDDPKVSGYIAAIGGRNGNAGRKLHLYGT